VEPNLKKLLNDNVEDKVNLSNNVSVYPRFTFEITLSVLPNLMAPLKDKDDPKSTKSITEMLEPMNWRPNIDTVLPNLT
jgi:hypothetical protein